MLQSLYIIAEAPRATHSYNLSDQNSEVTHIDPFTPVAIAIYIFFCFFAFSMCRYSVILVATY